MNWRKPLLSGPTDLTVTELLVPLAEIDDRGVYFEDSFTSWRDHIRQGAAIAVALRERLDQIGRASCRERVLRLV